jgi:O-acetyl-ADP-ribose deacetylase
MTPGFELPARFVVHVVGPVWQGGGKGEAEVLRRTYRRAFEVAAAEPRIRTIAFPAISTGAYAFPRELASRIAVDEMRSWEGRFDRIVACLFDAKSVESHRQALEETGPGTS